MNIPGSRIEKQDILWKQIGDPLGGLAPGQLLHGRFAADVHDGLLVAVVSRDAGLWHLSVSHRTGWEEDAETYSRAPTWDELKHAKYTLVPEDVPMVLDFPKKHGPYVNLHKTTLHLWEVRA